MQLACNDNKLLYQMFVYDFGYVLTGLMKLVEKLLEDCMHFVLL